MLIIPLHSRQALKQFPKAKVQQITCCPGVKSLQVTWRNLFSVFLRGRGGREAPWERRFFVSDVARYGENRWPINLGDSMSRKSWFAEWCFVLVPFPTGRPTKTTGEYVYFFEASHANSRFERVWEISRDPLQRCFQNRVCWEPENQTTIYSNPHKGRGYSLPTSHWITLTNQQLWIWQVGCSVGYSSFKNQVAWKSFGLS